MSEFYLEPPSHRERWRGYDSDANALDNARAECQAMLDYVELDENYKHRCISGEKVVYYDFPFALMPGHIYSEAGVDEFKISRACEYHFDEWFKEDDV
jgi:hypothetical protein